MSVLPIPPATTVPTLTTLSDYLSLNSYTLNRNLLTLNLNMLKSLPTNQQLTVSLAKLSTSSNVAVAATNNV